MLKISKPLLNPAAILVSERQFNELLKAYIESLLSGSERFFGDLFIFIEPNGVTHPSGKLLAECLPLQRGILQRYLGQLTKQMNKAGLMMFRKLCIGFPEVRDKDSSEYLLEEFPQNMRTSRLIHHKIYDAFIGETPQPIRNSVHLPAGFIGMEISARPRFIGKTFIPYVENFTEPFPHVHQTTGAQLEMKMEIQNLTYMMYRYSKTIMEPRGENEKIQSDSRFGESFGYDTFHQFVASLTETTVKVVPEGVLALLSHSEVSVQAQED
jgi:hypothetical protein